MLLDSYLQVTRQATGYQVASARRFASLSFGVARPRRYAPSWKQIRSAGPRKG